jgi:8-amino-7-oxononanoate synthase
MDGDITDVAQLLSIGASQPLLLDDAHGLGVLGEQGRGSWAAQGVRINQLQCLMGNFGKALSGAGGFLAGNRTVIDFIRQQARHYVYSTALSPALCRALIVSIRLCRHEQWRRDKLAANIGLFRELTAAAQLPVLPSWTAIQPVLCRDNAHVLACAAALKAHGIIVAAVRPPTVPQARLRISLSAAHESNQIRQLVAAIEQVFEEVS